MPVKPLCSNALIGETVSGTPENGPELHQITLGITQGSLGRTRRPVSLDLPNKQDYFGVSLPDKLSTFSLQLDAFSK